MSNLDFFYSVDHTPDDAAEVQDNVDAAKRLADGCEKESGDLLPFVSTGSTVHDLDRIRAALGERRLTYVGFSYGTSIGALYAQQYPTRIRAMVLDGALDPSVGFAEASVTQAEGFDGALEDFFAECRRRGSKCHLGDDPAASYDKLIAAIDAEPSPATTNGEERTLGPGEADIGVATALYAGREGWGTLSDVLDQVARGDGSGLMALSDSYTGRHPGGQYDNDTEAFYAIGCLDGTAPRTVEEVAQLAQRAEQTAPRLGGATVWLGLPCTFWPVPPTGEAAPVSAPGAPPIVVLGTTRDPATPLSWAQSLAQQLTSARLITFEGEGHTAYGRGDACVDREVDRYLIELTPPKNGTRCG